MNTSSAPLPEHSHSISFWGRWAFTRFQCTFPCLRRTKPHALRWIPFGSGSLWSSAWVCCDSCWWAQFSVLWKWFCRVPTPYCFFRPCLNWRNLPSCWDLSWRRWLPSADCPSWIPLGWNSFWWSHGPCGSRLAWTGSCSIFSSRCFRRSAGLTAPCFRIQRSSFISPMRPPWYFLTIWNCCSCDAWYSDSARGCWR